MPCRSVTIDRAPDLRAHILHKNHQFSFFSQQYSQVGYLLSYFRNRDASISITNDEFSNYSEEEEQYLHHRAEKSLMASQFQTYRPTKTPDSMDAVRKQFYEKRKKTTPAPSRLPRFSSSPERLNLSGVPTDLLLEVFKFLPVKELFNLELVSTSWRKFSLDNEELLWKTVCINNLTKFASKEEVEQVLKQVTSYREFMLFSGVYHADELLFYLQQKYSSGDKYHMLYSFPTSTSVSPTAGKKVLFHPDYCKQHCPFHEQLNIDVCCHISLQPDLKKVVFEALTADFRGLPGLRILMTMSNIGAYVNFLRSIQKPIHNIFMPLDMNVTGGMWPTFSHLYFPLRHLFKRTYDFIRDFVKNGSPSTVDDDILLGLHLLLLENDVFYTHCNRLFQKIPNIRFSDLLNKRSNNAKCWDTYVKGGGVFNALMGSYTKITAEEEASLQFISFQTFSKMNMFFVSLFEMPMDQEVQILSSMLKKPQDPSTLKNFGSLIDAYERMVHSFATQPKQQPRYGLYYEPQGMECNSVILDMLYHFHILHPCYFIQNTKAYGSTPYHFLNLASYKSVFFYIILQSSINLCIGVKQEQQGYSICLVDINKAQDHVGLLWTTTKYGHLRSAAFTNAVIDIDYARTNEGAGIILYQALKARNQQWNFSSLSFGFITSMLKDQFALTATSRSSGAPVVMKTRNNNLESLQRWQLQYLPRHKQK